MADDTRWLEDEEVRAWLLLAGLMESLPAVVNTQLKSSVGINHFEYMLLAGLSESPGRSLPMSQLATFAAGSLSRVSHALTRLESRGWVQRSARQGAGGQTSVTLTDEGMSTVEKAAPGHVELVRELLVDQLGSKRAIELGELAQVVLARVDPGLHALLTHRYP